MEALLLQWCPQSNVLGHLPPIGGCCLVPSAAWCEDRAFLEFLQGLLDSGRATSTLAVFVAATATGHEGFGRFSLRSHPSCLCSHIVVHMLLEEAARPHEVALGLLGLTIVPGWFWERQSGARLGLCLLATAPDALGRGGLRRRFLGACMAALGKRGPAVLRFFFRANHW